jgi:hypothetical protein
MATAYVPFREQRFFFWFLRSQQMKPVDRNCSDRLAGRDKRVGRRPSGQGAAIVDPGWTGFYIGINGGLQLGQGEHGDRAFP